jgi:hypothetical protein
MEVTISREHVSFLPRRYQKKMLSENIKAGEGISAPNPGLI